MTISPEHLEKGGPVFDYDETSPSLEHLKDLFSQYLAASGEQRDLTPIVGSFGVVSLPARVPDVVVSVDFCEVLRQTGLSCGRAMGNFLVEYPYAAATGLEEAQNMALVRGLMKAGQVTPIEGAPRILDILAAVRAKGGLVIGNTSTLAGCEVATMDFITKYYPGAFDGINFNTGGHHVAEGNHTKAWAVLSMLRQIDPAFTPSASDMQVIAIDDRPHHNRTFYEVFAGMQGLRTIAPLCRGEASLDHGRSTVVASPLEAFELLESMLAES